MRWHFLSFVLETLPAQVRFQYQYNAQRSVLLIGGVVNLCSINIPPSIREKDFTSGP